MDTAQQALFKAMLTDGWFTASDGNVESPTGYFGWVVNKPGDWEEVANEFEDTLTAYGTPGLDAEFYGVYSAYINSDGVIHIERHGDYNPQREYAYPPTLGIYQTEEVIAAQELFASRRLDYAKWLG